MFYWEVGNESLNKIQVNNNTLGKVNIKAGGRLQLKCDGTR